MSLQNAILLSTFRTFSTSLCSKKRSDFIVESDYVGDLLVDYISDSPLHTGCCMSLSYESNRLYESFV